MSSFPAPLVFETLKSDITRDMEIWSSLAARQPKSHSANVDGSWIDLPVLDI
ncbi:hypothetical protein CC86DRAFT_370797 [Ophiobolus disseminans]|uniref:Uncharacterized protein n=1 Tax=Ophiobolus disseminans TaxID=1469910 RepID=A0A6A6ZY31_9PLEO|nr:hypothetical protein CC86DRAFT_370797 [Ophiobolus disseminans]